MEDSLKVRDGVSSVDEGCTSVGDRREPAAKPAQAPGDYGSSGCSSATAGQGLTVKTTNTNTTQQTKTPDVENSLGMSIFSLEPDDSVYLDDDADDIDVTKADRTSLRVMQRLNSFPEGSFVDHTPRVNAPEGFWEKHVTKDRRRLMDRLDELGLCEYEVMGDGNCQFRSLSDQLYRHAKYQRRVRKAVIKELKTHPERYAPYVPGDYRSYCSQMAKENIWGDNITLQAASNTYGLKIILVTSYSDGFVINIEPHQSVGQRILYLSFWAEVHYNSIYPKTDPPQHAADGPDPRPPKVLGSRRLGRWMSSDKPSVS